MVSMISSRLMAGSRSTTWTTSSGDNSDKEQHAGAKAAATNAQNNNDSSSGGYSADGQSASSSGVPLPPILIDLHRKQKRKATAADAGETSKRRKAEELNFTAATVRADLTRAGKAYPLPNTKRCRIAIGIDISTVQLMSSTAAKASPFLHTSSYGGWSSGGRYDILTDFGSAYRDVLYKSRSAYQPSGVVTPTRSKSPSSNASASSLSDTESDDSHASSSIVVVRARLDDSLLGDEAQSKGDDIEQEASRFITCPPSMSMAMEEAVGVCDSSRLVTTSSSPYKTVFVNAAYAALTGVGSDETLGRYLHDLVAPDGSKSGKLSLEACAALSSEGNDMVVLIVCRKGDSAPSCSSITKCYMKVTPIVLRTAVKPASAAYDALGDVREVDNVTHFAIDFMHITDSSSESRSENGSNDDSNDQPLVSVVVG